MDLHKSQIFFYLLLSFLIGVAFASFFNIHHYFFIAGLISGLLGIMLFWRRNWRYVFYSFVLLFFIFGGIRTQSFKLTYGILNEFAGKDFNIILKGYINGEVEK